jgi:hypothetical protein
MEYLEARSVVGKARLVILQVKVLMRGGRFFIFHMDHTPATKVGFNLG